ncbi:MAG: hypothetical protein UY36_C0015G0006 [Parcubacteria group bacterium GW2011_GWA1_49_11]|nr:MAG: hypothetical protein UY36_C0015G0006 [Parcubacteria group bacterium GW2011_GWA1_49_11]
MIMKTLIENKVIVGAIAIFILVIFLYNIFLKDKPNLIPDESATTRIGEDLLRTHAELQRVTFDKTLLTSPSYLGLVDFGLGIPQQPTGRPNPFDIIGRD